jgi:hypothetical protein
MNPDRKSGWTTFFQVCSTLSLIIGVFILITAIQSSGNKQEELLVSSVIAIVSGFNGFFIAFLIQIMFECRNYLKRIDSKLKDSNEMYSAPNLPHSEGNSAALLVAFLVVAVVFVVIIKFK